MYGGFAIFCGAKASACALQASGYEKSSRIINLKN
jgi:hypothetical protein